MGKRERERERERVFSHLWWWHSNALKLVSQSHRLWHYPACHTSYNLISEIHPVALLASALLPVDAARRGTFLWMVHKELLKVINKTSTSKSRLKASNKDEKEQIMTTSHSVITYTQRFAIPDIWTINLHVLAKISHWEVYLSSQIPVSLTSICPFISFFKCYRIHFPFRSPHWLARAKFTGQLKQLKPAPLLWR